MSGLDAGLLTQEVLSNGNHSRKLEVGKVP